LAQCALLLFPRTSLCYQSCSMKTLVIAPLTLFFAPLVSHADLLAHWTLEEGSGTVAGDSSANDQTGTIAGGALWNTTDLPPVSSGTTAALQMDGVDDQVDIVGFKGISGTGDRTIAVWIKTELDNSNQNRGIVSWGANLSTQKWTFRIQTANGTPGAIRIEANGGFFVGNTVVTDSQWHHVAVTWADDGTPDVLDARLYVDGVLDAEFGSLDTPPSASQSVAINTAVGADVRIGDNFQGNHNWLGGMDDVRIYDEALDAEAIADLAFGIPILTSFEASAEAIASGTSIALSWTSDPGNDTLSIDNEVGDVSGMTTVMVTPTADSTYTLTGTRGAATQERKVTVLVDSAPLVESFINSGSPNLLAGQSRTVSWDAFGEASLSINGTEVTGEDQTVLSPTETTTYILSATNPFGTTTAELTITVLDAKSPDLGWSAVGLPDGTLTQWDPAINATGNNGITFINNTGGEVQSGSSNFSGVNAWVNSAGYNLAANPLDSWQDGLGDPVTKEDVSWEMVFRPGDFTGTHTLFNTGGSGAGTAIVLIDSTLDFRVQGADNDDQRIIIPIDLATLGNATDFFHIVATLDMDAANPSTATLYVNGQMVSSPVTSAGIIGDWDGGDLAELGKGGNIPTNVAFPFENYTGDIARFNYYRARILDASQVSTKYTAIGGSGGDLTIKDIDYDGVAGEIRITFVSIPGRSYALESSVNLAAPSWSEIDDSILADGTETTTVLTGINLPGPENPRRFYRILPGVE
jgi:hypothetical protein